MRLDPQAWLKDAQRTQVGGGSGARLRDGLVVVQLAMSVMLLVGAGLLARSFLRLLDAADPASAPTQLRDDGAGRARRPDDAAGRRAARARFTTSSWRARARCPA